MHFVLEIWPDLMGELLGMDKNGVLDIAEWLGLWAAPREIVMNTIIGSYLLIQQVG